MKTERFIALDIGPDSIELAVFVLHGSGEIELADHGRASIDSAPGVEMAREAQVATALKRLLDEKKCSARKAALVIDGQSVFSRLVRLPPVSADRVEQTIRHEAVQNIPFAINEVVWDSHIVDAAASEPEVLLAAVKADLIDGLVHAVKANGLDVELINVAPAAQANAVRFSYPELTEPLLLVDAGEHSANLVFMDGTRLFFRTLPVSGNMTARLMQEIERSITFYCNQQAGRAPERLLIAGELSGYEEFSDRFKLPVGPFEPLRNIKQSVAVADQSRLGALVGAAVHRRGAPAVEINLEPAALRKERSMRKRQPLWAAGGLLGLLIPALWIGGAYVLAGQARQEAAAVEARVQALEAVEQQLLPLERRMADLEETAQVYREVIARRTFWLEALMALNGQLADGMFVLESSSLKNGDMLAGMRVEVVSYLDKEPEGSDAVILLRDRLRASPVFSEETKVHKRPTKGPFARRFVLDIFFEEAF